MIANCEGGSLANAPRRNYGKLENFSSDYDDVCDVNCCASDDTRSAENYEFDELLSRSSGALGALRFKRNFIPQRRKRHSDLRYVHFVCSSFYSRRVAIFPTTHFAK